jgi:hypothetical protein
MKEKKPNQIQNQYIFDKHRNAYLIEISLDDYDDVYNEWDPTPFKRRFIQEEFDYFIVSSSEDIPLIYNLIIVLYIPERKKDTNKEASVISAYRNYYSYAKQKVDKDRIKLKNKSASNFMISVLFLATGYFIKFGNSNVLLEIIKEGIFIGGWVFLWEFFTSISTTRKELNVNYKMYERLYYSEIKFVYT